MTTINSKGFVNFKDIIKHPIRHQGDGQDLEVDIRDDQDQLVKLQEIIDILVAAGYFRARIKGLSAFDKVVGGMTWCIELCKVDIDVDLLFQENSTIGQKIALTEKIVAVLPKLKCPHAIEPHQIQGLDFIHIYPVVQWLVKLSVENREEMSSFVRSYAVNQFNKQFQTEMKSSKPYGKLLDGLKVVQEVYRPHRYFKRKTAAPPNLESRVQITLLEYGHKNDNRGHISNNVENELGHEDIEQELIHYEELSTEEKENVNKHYATLNNELKDGVLKSGLRNQVEILEEKKKVLLDECKKLAILQQEKDTELNNCILSSKELVSKQQETEKKLNELESTMDNSSGKLEEIENLVILSDNLKAKEIQFKEKCKTELTELQKLLDGARASKLKSSEDVESELKKEVEEIAEKIGILRLQLAKKNRHVYALQRKLDEVPSRAELAQYQKRFMELYNQVSAKHKETKQYYTLYNTLVDTRLYMQKQLSLLNSISDNYPEAMRSSAGKEEFITQFQNILESVRQSKDRVKQKLDEEKETRDKLSMSLQSLIEQQRKYVSALRKLSVECRKHEALLNKKNNLHQKNK